MRSPAMRALQWVVKACPWCFYPVSQTRMLHWMPEHRKSSGIEPPRVRNPSDPNPFRSFYDWTKT